MQDQKPTIGRFVHYKPSEVERKRMKDANNCNESSLLPAVITAVWSDSCVNLKVLLDGEGDLWATSRSRGENEGNWDWPVKS